MSDDGSHQRTTASSPARCAPPLAAPEPPFAASSRPARAGRAPCAYDPPRTHGPTSTIIENFTGREVTGRMGPADSARVIDDTLPKPAFNSTDLELVVRSIP